MTRSQANDKQTPTTDDSRPASGSEASDTPETDNALMGVWYRGDHGSAIPALCRKLERERNDARSKQLRSLDGASDAAAMEDQLDAVKAALREYHCGRDRSLGARLGMFRLSMSIETIFETPYVPGATMQAETGAES